MKIACAPSQPISVAAHSLVACPRVGGHNHYIRCVGHCDQRLRRNVGFLRKRRYLPFSPMFQVDVTNMVESSGLDITFPGLPDFDSLSLEGPSPPLWSIIANNSSSDALILLFSTAPTPGSLVDFTGGTILGNVVDNPSFAPLYLDFTGTITPVPEPSSLVPLVGCLGWLVFGLARRFRKKSAI